MRVPATERRQQLIDAAIRLMRREGVEGTTLRAIAREANAPLAAVHYCFVDKDELMHAALDYWLHELIDSSGNNVKTDGGLRATVTEFMNRFWSSLENEPLDLVAQLELVVFAIRQAGTTELATTIYPRYVNALDELLSQALATSGEQSLINPNELARALVCILDGVSLQYLANPDSPAARELYVIMVDAVLTKAGV